MERISLSPAEVQRLTRTHFNMTNQPPTPERIERIERVREHYKRLATIVYLNCPESRERALALTGLEEALMWTVASIAREAWEDVQQITQAEIEAARARLAELEGADDAATA